MKLVTSLAILLIAIAAVFGQHTMPARVTFLAGDSTELPFRIVNNLIIVDVSLNGNSGNFIFDTGAESTVVDDRFAIKVGLKQSGKTTSNGATGSATAGVLKGAKVELGNLAANGLTVYSLPLDSFAPSFGFPIDGIIGNDIIASVVAEIDYQHKRLRLVAPAAFKPRSSAEVIPLTIADGLAFINAEVIPVGGKPLRARMEVDTGSTGMILLNSPFVQRNKMIAALKASQEYKTGGVGGTGNITVGRLSAFSFGKRVIREPIAVLYTGTKGDNASREYDGLLGGGIFRRFEVTVDIPGRRLFLEPGPDLDESFDIDMSGLEILADGPDLKTFLVDEVRPDSAGARAGIEGGDTIQAIDGKAAQDLGLDEIHRLMRKNGATYEVTVDRRGKLIHVRLVLHRVI